MSFEIILLTAALTGSAAVLLTRWMRVLARSDSAWLRLGLHVVLAALGGAGAAALARNGAEVVAFAFLALACSLLVVIDLAAYRLPDLIVGPMYPILFGSLTVAAAVSADWASLGRSAAAGGVFLLGYLILAFITPSGLGLGDVKLAGLLGAFLGWLSWSQAILGTMAAFVLSAVYAIVLLLTTQATRRTAFPFGPWMIAGAALAAGLGPALFTGIG